MERAEAALQSMEDMRDYATRLTLPNERRTLEEKGQDLHRYGEEQRKVLQECSRLKLTADNALRSSGADLTLFIRETLTPWTQRAMRQAQAGDPPDSGDVVLMKLRELLDAFEREARASLSPQRLTAR